MDQSAHNGPIREGSCAGIVATRRITADTRSGSSGLRSIGESSKWSSDMKVPEEVADESSGVGKMASRHQYRDPGASGDIGVREVFEVRKQEHVALNPGQRLQRSQQCRPMVCAVVGQHGRDCGAWCVVSQGFGPVSPRGPQVVQRQVPGNAKEPRLEVNPIPTGVKALKRPNECVLREIFRGGPVAGEGKCTRERPSLVALNERRKRLTVSRQYGADKGIVWYHSGLVATSAPVTIRARRDIACVAVGMSMLVSTTMSMPWSGKERNSVPTPGMPPLCPT